jgi:hypothetical protein
MGFPALGKRVKQNADRWTIITITFFFSSSWMLQSLVFQFYTPYSGCRTLWLRIQALCKAPVSGTHGQIAVLSAGFEVIIPERILP